MSLGNSKKSAIYLDHLIERESLRYHQRIYAGTPYAKQNPQWLPLSELVRVGKPDEPSAASFLRKPDFQRATLSWTADDCVLLLQSIVDRLVVPSIILWTNSNSTYRYILDGAHRVSVVKAWLTDDWGSKVAALVAEDEDQENEYLEAAKEVQELVRDTIGLFKDYKIAYDEKRRIEESDSKPENEMDENALKRAIFYQDYINQQIALPLLWVEGDYEVAEKSFLRINQGGRSLSGWETRIIEYRNSSAMRVIMSICSATSAEHYWPSYKKENNSLGPKIQLIHEGIKQIRTTIFTPTPKKPFVPERHPIIGGVSQDKKPDYLGELLCVLQHGKGSSIEITAMLDNDNNTNVQDTIVDNGLKLINATLDGLSHLFEIENAAHGTNKYQNKSLGLVPLLYFYQESGKFISSLVYGFLYWLLSGNQTDIINRKRIFSVYRKSFERILFLHKGDVVGGLSRKIGSGTEVTYQTAQYFDQLLRVLAKYNGNLELSDFQNDYLDLIKELLGKEAPTSFELQDIEINGRFFSPKQKAVKAYRHFFRNHVPCEICGGFIDLTTIVQHDHKMDHSQGGRTSTANQQISHPFCNNPVTKALISSANNGPISQEIPSFK